MKIAHNVIYINTVNRKNKIYTNKRGKYLLE